MCEGLEESASLPNVRNKGRARLDGVGDMEHARHCLHDGGYDRNRGAWRAGHGCSADRSLLAGVCALASLLDMATFSRPSALDGEGGAAGA